MDGLWAEGDADGSSLRSIKECQCGEAIEEDGVRGCMPLLVGPSGQFRNSQPGLLGGKR